MGYTDREFMAAGDRLNPAWVTPWVEALVSAARKDLDVLKGRGINEAFLAKVEKLNADVSAQAGGRGESRKAAKGLTIAQNDEHAAALDWWHDAKGIALQAFEAEADKLVEFRVGVRVGQSIPRLRLEMKSLLGSCRKFVKELSDFGGTEAFIKQGDAALAGLAEADGKQEAARKALPADTQELNRKKGELYVLARRILRAGRLVFRKSPGRAMPYSYEILRRGEAGAKAARTREANKEKPAAQ